MSVIVPVRNDAEALPQAIETCLTQQSCKIAEIVLAVAPSSDGTETVAASLAALHAVVHVVQNPSGTTPAGLNLAIAASTGDVIVRVDARSQLPPDYIANAIETLELTGAGNVGAIQWPVGRGRVQRAIAAAMVSWLGSGGAAYRVATETRQVDTAYLGAFRRSALEEVGGFDESFVRNQDAELNERLNRAGHEVWLDPRLVVEYSPRPKLRALARQFWQYGWWRRITGKKHPRSLRPRQLIPPVVLLTLLASVVAAIWVPAALLLVVAYPVGVLIVSLFTSGLSVAERFVMAAALITMHMSWAAGFIASSLALLVTRNG